MSDKGFSKGSVPTNYHDVGIIRDQSSPPAEGGMKVSTLVTEILGVLFLCAGLWLIYSNTTSTSTKTPPGSAALSAASSPNDLDMVKGEQIRKAMLDQAARDKEAKANQTKKQPPANPQPTEEPVPQAQIPTETSAGLDQPSAGLDQPSNGNWLDNAWRWVVKEVLTDNKTHKAQQLQAEQPANPPSLPVEQPAVQLPVEQEQGGWTLQPTNQNTEEARTVEQPAVTSQPVIPSTRSGEECTPQQGMQALLIMTDQTGLTLFVAWIHEGGKFVFSSGTNKPICMQVDPVTSTDQVESYRRVNVPIIDVPQGQTITR